MKKAIYWTEQRHITNFCKEEPEKSSQAIQSYVWDFNVTYMEEGEKEFTYLQDELGSTVRLLEQGGENQTIYGYGEF